MLAANTGRTWRPLGVNSVGSVMAIAVVTALIAPRTTLAILIVLVMLLYASVASVDVRDTSRLMPPIIAALSIFAVYLLLSSIWAAAPLSTIYIAAIGFATLLVSWAATVGLALLSPLRCQKLANALLIGFSIGLAFLMIEELTDDWIKLWFLNNLPFVQRNPKHMVLRDAEILNLASYLNNRSIALASLLLWPMLGMLAALRPSGVPWVWRGAASVAIVGLAIVTIVKSQHETSALAVALGAVVFLVARFRQRLGAALVGFGWVVAVVFVIPLANFAYDSLQLQRAESLPFSARARIVIWKYTASEVVNSPLIGVGAGSTERLDNNRASYETATGDPVALRTMRHAHNIYLQVWYELGVIGAALLVLIGASVIGAASRLRPQAQPYAFAAFATIAAMGATSWSPWQEWFMAAFALTGLCCWLVDRMVVGNNPQSLDRETDVLASTSLSSAAAVQ